MVTISVTSFTSTDSMPSLIKIRAFHTHRWLSSEGDELLKILLVGLLTLQGGAGFQHWILRHKEI